MRATARQISFADWELIRRVSRVCAWSRCWTPYPIFSTNSGTSSRESGEIVRGRATWQRS